MISYRIDFADLHEHLYRITLTIAKPAAQQIVSLPVWIPGSYMVREFARHLSGLRARQGSRQLEVHSLDKACWQVRCEGGAALTLSYEVYAYDTSVRAAYLDANRGFFNGTSLFLRVHGRESEPHHLQLRGLPKAWQLATALPVAESGAASYVAAHYDELVDHPVELGNFWRGEFTAAGVPHEFVVTGALPDFDGQRLLDDARRICEAEIAFWHGATPPSHFTRYVFMLNAVEDGYGGLEHRASTALICARRDLPQHGKAELSDGYVTLLGLISHEYFHTWNVKQLRPLEFAHYDYTQENYTELLWFFEGFTSYYDDLLLLRAGLIDGPRYLKLLSKTVTAVLGSPGRKLQSVAQASFDAWVKHYRSDENTPNATISYYTKGSLVALALDLTLRSEGRGTLDEVMQLLWAKSSGGPISEADIAAALEQVAGRSFDAELSAWVHGTEDLALRSLLAALGISWTEVAPTMAQRMGVRVSESALTGIKVSQVLRDGAGEGAGLAAGDELIAINGWRIRRLDDAQRVLPSSGKAQLMVVRDQRVLQLSLQLAPHLASGSVVLQCVAAADASQATIALRQVWWQG